jgi:hypothetical protein
MAWIWLVSAGTLLGAAAGWALGATIRALSLDYVVFVSEFVSTGARGGLLLGTALGASVVFGRGCPTGAEISRVVMVLAGGVAGCTVVGALLAFSAAKVGVWTFQPGIPIHPGRVAFALGAWYGAGAGALLMGAGACIWLVRRQGIRSSSS